jgi:hypothetical protein
MGVRGDRNLIKFLFAHDHAVYHLIHRGRRRQIRLRLTGLPRARLRRCNRLWVLRRGRRLLGRCRHRYRQQSQNHPVHIHMFITFRITLISKVSIRQLKYHVHNCCRIHRLPVSRGRLETHLVGGGDGGFVKSMAQPRTTRFTCSCPFAANSTSSRTSPSSFRFLASLV